MKINLMGNLTKDVKLKAIEKKDGSGSFNVLENNSIAVQSALKGEDGKYLTDFYELGSLNNGKISSIAGNFAEYVEKTFEKGDTVLVSGDLVVNHYTKKDGTEGMSLCICADSIQPVYSQHKKLDARKAQQTAPAQAPVQQAAPQQFQQAAAPVPQFQQMPAGFNPMAGFVPVGQNPYPVQTAPVQTAPVQDFAQSMGQEDIPEFPQYWAGGQQ